MRTEEFGIPEFTDEFLTNWVNEEIQQQDEMGQEVPVFDELKATAIDFVNEFFEVNPEPSARAVAHFLSEGIRQAYVATLGKINAEQVYFFHTVGVLIGQRLS